MTEKNCGDARSLVSVRVSATKCVSKDEVRTRRQTCDCSRSYAATVKSRRCEDVSFGRKKV